MNIVIIGNSAAGCAAVEIIRKHDPQSSITQLSEETHPLYSRCLLSYYIAGSINKDTLLYREPGFHRKMNVDLYTGPQYRVVSVNPNDRTVTCENKEVFHYDKLLIAAGASAKLPPHIPKDIDGVFVLRTIDDVERILARIPHVKQAVVQGGGLIGMKAATALAQRGIKTTVAIRSDRVLSQMIDFDASLIISRQLRENGIDVLFNTDIVEVMSQENVITGIKTDIGDVLPCDLLIIAKGVAPNTRLIDNTGITVRQGIVTDSHMQTDNEFVFAAGDVAETFDIAIEEHTINALWTCAVQQGRIAGLNMVGIPTHYDGTIGMNSLNICGISLISFGITSLSPEEESKYKIVSRLVPQSKLYKKIVISPENRVKGIILLGRIENAGVLLSLIQRKIDVSQFIDELTDDRFNFGKILKYGGKAELNRYYNQSDEK